MSGVLTAAYGRRYKTRQDACTDWRAGKDFIFNNPSSPWNGKYCSCRDFTSAQKLELRYGLNNERVTIITGGAETESQSSDDEHRTRTIAVFKSLGRHMLVLL